MKSFLRIGTVLRHQDRLVVFFVPCFRLFDDTVGNHVELPGVGVPRVVPVEADNVQVLCLFVCARKR